MTVLSREARDAPMTWKWPVLSFRCGACGTQATGFQLPSEVRDFQAAHGEVCKGFPPVTPQAGIVGAEPDRDDTHTVGHARDVTPS